MKRSAFMVAGVLGALGLVAEACGSDIGPSAADHTSIQSALDANPGQIVFLPSGDYEISEKIRIRTDHSGLWGPGRIVQTNPDQPILEIEGVSGVRIRDLTLTRPDDRNETPCEGVLALQCRDLVLEGLRVIDNRTRSGAIVVRECQAAEIRNCLVQNYMRISIDDRTNSDDWGYAFHCIDGSGIVVKHSTGTLIQGNRVVEEHLLPTPEIKEEYQLGEFVKKNAVKGTIISQKVWDEEYVNNWHQGSAIIVTSPEVSDYTRIVGNSIENAAQGIDIHSDHVIIAQNIVNNAFMGMKAMHGSRNVLVIGNQFSKNDLWSIGMMPGASSHAGSPALPRQDAVPANVDGGSIIANNIISDFGYGHAHWIWGDDGIPIKFDRGQKPENPPLADVVVQGNVVYDTGRAEGTEPRYRYAVLVPSEVKRIRFSGNIFHPGREGVSNMLLGK
jgi:parallel beta helix pectate lyase-like protein